jgi:hypothetical protein
VAVSWLLAAHAQEPAPAPAPAPEPEPAPVSEEVIVYGQLRVEQARAAVVQRLEDMGYTEEVVDLGDRVVYRHAAAWHGEVVLHDDGWMVVQRQPMRVEGRRMPWADRDTPLAWVGCHLWPWLCVRISGGSYSHRKWMAVETATVQALHEPVRTWGDRVADLNTERKIDGLPARLQALWEQGAPLSGDEALPTYAQRRAALLEFYASRTDTVWGDAVRDAVAAFLRAVVQRSDEPLTAEEIERYAREHPDTPLQLEVPAEP